MSLPGVKVGPLDPDRTSEFGQVAQANSARTLIRLHRQQNPPELQRALARPMDEGHSKAVSESLEQVGEHVAGLKLENGDPVVPEGAEIVGAAVRGERATGQVLTFQFRLPSGRVGKWFTPYTPETLPGVFETGQEYRRVQEMKDRGVVSFDTEATGSEIYRRRLAESQAEARRLRAALEGRSSESADDVPEGGGEPVNTGNQTLLAEQLEEANREREELRARVAQYEALAGAQGGGVPTGGLEEDYGRTAAEVGAGQSSAQEPPFEGYDELKADQVVERLKAEGTSDDERRAILAYESSHANRRTVVGCAEQQLDRS